MGSQISRRTLLVAGPAMLAAPTILRAATTHDVQMLTKHPEDKKLRNVFFPRIQIVEAGDTVNFLATDKGHNSASSKGMIPDGAEAWNGKINKDISVTFAAPGLYGYQCTPHMSVGMVGLVAVRGEGMMDNLEAVQGVRQRGKAKSVWAEIWEELDSMNLA